MSNLNIKKEDRSDIDSNIQRVKSKFKKNVFVFCLNCSGLVLPGGACPVDLLGQRAERFLQKTQHTIRGSKQG